MHNPFRGSAQLVVTEMSAGEICRLQLRGPHPNMVEQGDNSVVPIVDIWQAANCWIWQLHDDDPRFTWAEKTQAAAIRESYTYFDSLFEDSGLLEVDPPAAEQQSTEQPEGMRITGDAMEFVSRAAAHNLSEGADHLDNYTAAYEAVAQAFAVIDKVPADVISSMAWSEVDRVTVAKMRELLERHGK